MTKQQLNFPKLLSRSDLRVNGLGFSNVHMLRLERDGKFPKRVYLSPYKVAWVESEILDWLAAKAEERRQ